MTVMFLLAGANSTMANRSDVLAAATGTAKGVISRIPVLGELIAGLDSYKQAQFERETTEFLRLLDETLNQVGERLDPAWFGTPDGESFARKVLDCGIDA